MNGSAASGYQGQQGASQQQRPTLPYVSSPYIEHSQSIQQLTDPKSLIDDFENMLRCRRVLDDGSIYKFGRPLMNDEGISTVLGLTASVLNRDLVWSNYDENEVKSTIMSFSDSLIKVLMVNKHNFSIRDDTTRSAIVNAAQNLVYPCIKRPFQEGERRFWKGSQQDFRITNVASEAKKDWLSFFKFSKNK